MKVIYAPDQLPAGTRFYMDDFHGFGKRYIDIFRFASPESKCLGMFATFGECSRAAKTHHASVITTNVFAAYGARDILDGLDTKIYIIPAPIKYHALYLNLFPYLLTIAEIRNEQVVLSKNAVEEMMVRLGHLWHRNTGYLRNHSLFFDPDYVRANLHKIELIQKKLSNQTSKDAFTRFVYADPFDQTEYVITNLLSKIQYFDYISPPPGGVVINCGVDNGWELPFFLSTMGANAKIYNIDPTGNENLSDYSALFCNSPFCKNIITFHQLAVWDSCGELEFTDNTVREKGTISEGTVKFAVESVTIDHFCQINSITVIDIIKMDLEGAEPHAIRGMMNTVHKCRPQLAICVYHGKDQCLDIPFGLINDLQNYNFYFDTYFIDTGESVLYCIPKEIDRRVASPIVLESVLTAD